MTRDGVWEHWFGMWFSSLILLPIGVFLTYKAMNDSVIMNADTYVNFFKKIFFIREKRKYPVKSIIIDPPDYGEIIRALAGLSDEIDRFFSTHGRLSYKAYWTDGTYEEALRSIKSSMEIMLNQLSNSRNLEELAKAEQFPVLITKIKPFEADSIWAKISMYFFPAGILLRLLAAPLAYRTKKDLKNVQRLSGEMIGIIRGARVQGSLVTA